jgi:hypothetical protein
VPQRAREPRRRYGAEPDRRTRPSPPRPSRPEQVVGALGDAFAEQVAEHEVVKIGRRREDDEADVPSTSIAIGTSSATRSSTSRSRGGAAARRHAGHAGDGGPGVGRGIAARRPVEIAARVGEKEGDHAGGIVQVEHGSVVGTGSCADRRWRPRRCARPRRSARACRCRRARPRSWAAPRS